MKDETESLAKSRRLDDLEYIAGIIWDCLQATCSPEHHTRFVVAGKIAPTDGNGDVQWPTQDDDLRAIIGEFRQLPPDEQRRILSGWNPEAIKVDRGDYSDAEYPLIPYLMMNVVSSSSPFDDAKGEFTAIRDDGPYIAKLFLLPGTTKKEAMHALKCFTEQIDRHWDRLIVDPLNRGAR